MKLCPQCEKESPSTVNNCWFCGEPLVADAELSAEARLQKELNDAQKQKQVLTNALSDAQKGLVPKITERDAEIAQLKKTLEGTSKLHDEKQLLEATLATLNNKHSALQKELSAEQSKNNELSKQVKKLHPKGKTPTFLYVVMVVLISVIGILSFQTYHYKQLSNVCTVTRPDGVSFIYAGKIQNGLPNGKGKATYADGRIYEGDFTDGFRNGKGKMTYSDSTTYEGDYVQDNITYSRPNGDYVKDLVTRTYYYVIGGTVLLMVLLMVLSVIFKNYEMRKKKRQAKITELEKENQAKNYEMINRQVRITVLEKENQANQAKINDLQEKINKLKKSTDSDSSSPPPVSNSLYADSINYGYFKGVSEHPNDYAIYELEKSDELTANFTIYKEAYGTVLECPDLIYGCDVQKIGNSSLEVEEKGIATLEDGKWKVTKKAKVGIV
ncbi:hypothetical protein AGMMS49965_24940 [Bacteroidia bacterium]|nr:hypothetical protein AGMMS49965_24940 [Bacteroidia bacterium]